MIIKRAVCINNKKKNDTEQRITIRSPTFNAHDCSGITENTASGKASL